MSEFKICPKCHEKYNGVPALSREDNSTLICPRCGTIEALDAAREMYGSNMTEEEYRAYKESVLEIIERGSKKCQRR